MKALPLVLAASLVANAALVTVHFRGASSGSDASTGSSSRAGSSVNSSASGKSSASAADQAAAAAAALKLPPHLVATLNTGNAEALRDFLRAAGFSDDLVRSIVQMRIWKNYETRFKALNPQANDDPNKPWWKDDRNQNRYGSMTKAQREESRRLQHEVRDESERLLGPDNSRWQDQRLSFLPLEKRQSLREIQQDYQELMSDVQQEMNGFRLPADVEKLRFLQEEQKRDIEALMTPEERQAYELRMSPTAQQLRWKMTQYDATEAEYTAIFPLQKAFDEKYNPRNNDPYGDQPQRDQNFWKERQQAEKQLQDQIKTLLGEQRYAESIRLQDNDYQQLEAATRRLELPTDTAKQIYSLRETTSSAALQIADNPGLDTDQKKAALATLAATTRDQVRARLGAEGAEAYFKNNGMTWLKEIEKGNTVTFNADSSNWNTKSLPKEPKKPAAK